VQHDELAIHFFGKQDGIPVIHGGIRQSARTNVVLKVFRQRQARAGVVCARAPDRASVVSNTARAAD
jgi:hypothetical protein